MEVKAEDTDPGTENYVLLSNYTPTISGNWAIYEIPLGDFGNFELTGLGFDAVDGEYALFDHIYLGRTREDFNYIETPVGDHDSRVAELRMNGRTGEEAQRYAEASMHLKQATLRMRTKDYDGAREYLEKVFALMPKSSPLHRRATKVLSNIKQ